MTPLDLVADDERQPQTTDFAGSPWSTRGLTRSRRRLVGVLVEHERLAGLDDRASRKLDERDRLVGEAHAALDRVREVDRAGLAVEDPDVDDLGVEDLLDLVADEVVHRLHVELARRGLAGPR